MEPKLMDKSPVYAHGERTGDPQRHGDALSAELILRRGCGKVHRESGERMRKNPKKSGRTAKCLSSGTSPSEGSCGKCEYIDICGGCRAPGILLSENLMAEEPVLSGDDP